ncbi:MULTISPECIES: GtrA family protein [Burkholderia]|uniref:GtrA family protein n=1 Tax=Burkholderia TaxID=32008 RepID=UPI0005594BB0|nr:MULTISPECIES: GtrA family protein [Burkholderia]HDR9081985.1 GtrA family protein [Burkholderia vietnamiensis]
MIQVTLLYCLFAGISMVANLGAQATVIRIYSGPYQVLAALAIGTGAGLIVKYVLDKRWIFSYRTEGAVHDAKLFVLYSLMGVATTTIFWGAEFAFDHAFGTEAMRYLGGAIGLTIGYIVKYKLDRAFVFRTA